MTLTPRFRFGPITGVISAKFALSRGTSPSVCVITVPPVPGLDLKPKPMIWSDGFRTLTFKDCIINDVSPSIDGDGFERWNIAIVDRRWKWKYGYVSGRYNVRSGGVILKETKKSVQELAKICFEAMGEKNPNVKQMPNDLYPHFDWTDPVAPNVALDQLCQVVNCHVVLTEKDTAAVYPDGYGKDLPQLPNTSRGVSFDFGAGPGKVTMLSAPVKWQLNLDLVAVGLDKDNTIKLLNDLSYTPELEDGKRAWDKETPPLFLNVEKKYRKLAQESVWKWYQILPPGWAKFNKGTNTYEIKPVDNSFLKMPGTNLSITSVRQLFPILDHQLDYQKMSQTDKTRVDAKELDPLLQARKPAQVLGFYYDGQGKGEDNIEENRVNQIAGDDSNELDWEAPLVYDRGFNIDQDRGLVLFSEPVYRFNNTVVGNEVKDRKYSQAALVLRVAVNFHDISTRAPYRLFLSQAVRGASDPKLEAVHLCSDAVPEFVTKFDWETKRQVPVTVDVGTDGKIKSVKNMRVNIDDVDKRLKSYLGLTMRKYETKTPAQAQYPFLVEFAPDGMIAQVGFEISQSGEMSTMISKEREEISNMPTYDERRQAIQLKATLDQVAAKATQQDPNKNGK